MNVGDVGRMVHYFSYGTPNGEYSSQCRAAVIAGISDSWSSKVDLVVFNPTGLFFNEDCRFDGGDADIRSGGTWHWPEPSDE